MNNLRSLFTYCWYLYADYCHILRAVSLRSRGCAWRGPGAHGRVRTHRAVPRGRTQRRAARGPQPRGHRRSRRAPSTSSSYTVIWETRNQPPNHPPNTGFPSYTENFFGYWTPMPSVLPPDKPQRVRVTIQHICDPYKKYNYMYHDKAICHLKIILIIHYTSYFTII